ncbi:hypothetical protein GNP94_21920 [Paenibacillus campinasensis]|uniref:Tail fiber protein n=1 Tax=Paenibacillus campinasensis TaxID=66347 RepID=A0ABW9T6W6_9BACL|nr:phage tail protein [Paenibacillus campinasensis]MUG68632.1 hypothetical protein [Paenibacillus campinasensis]
MAYERKAPEWRAPGIEPPESKKTEGWGVLDKPPAAWWNWFMTASYEAIKELQDKAAEKEWVQEWVDEQIEHIDADIPDASLTEKGIVQLSNAINSTSESQAATPRAVKTAYDEALAAKQLGVEQKANVVAALNSIGVTASTNDTWAQLVDKMAGVIRATGNATAADLLSGRTASNASGPITGTMPNRGAVSQTITTQNGSYNVPAGYHNGSGVIRAAFANLIASNIRAGVNVGGVVGSLIEGRKFAKGSVSPDLNGNGRYLVPIDAFVPSVVVLWRAGGNGSGNNYLNGLAMGQLPRLENGEPNYVSESGPLLFSDSYNVPVYISRGYFQPNNIFFPGQVTIFSDGYMTGTWNYIFFE